MMYTVVNPGHLPHSGHDLSQQAESALADWAPVAIGVALLVGLYKLGSAELPSLENAISYKLTSGPAATTSPIIQSSMPAQVANVGGSTGGSTGLTSDQISQLQSLLNLAQNLNGTTITSGAPPSSTANSGTWWQGYSDPETALLAIAASLGIDHNCLYNYISANPGPLNSSAAQASCHRLLPV